MYNTNNYMKSLSKVIGLFFILTALFKPELSSAQVLTPLTATINGTVITATLTGVSAENVEKVNIFTIKGLFPATAYCPIEPCLTNQPTKEVVGNTIKWTIKNGITGQTVYNIRAEGKNGYSFISNVVPVKTGMETIDATWPLTATTDGSNAYIKGKLNNPSPSDFTAKLEYSITPLDTAGTTTASTYGPKLALKANTNAATYGIADDGTYFYRLSDLTPGTTYSIRQTIESKNGAREIKIGAFNSSTGIVPENSITQAQSDAQRSYSLLAPLPGLNVVLDNDLCREYVAQGKPVPGGSCDNQISYFINLLIRMLIGLTVVILVVKVIFEGYQYMVTDIPFIKANAKSKLFESFFGLVLALASYLILNTINPRLINGGISIDNIDLAVINDFEVSGTFTGSFDNTKLIKVNFNKDAYPAAKAASEKTGVPTSFILAIFAQETGSGKNLGTCVWSAPGVMREDNTRKDKTAFTTIMSELGIARESKSVSCPFGGGWGGAIGYTQFIPTTWLEQRVQAKTYLGHTPNPWKLEDAIMTSAVYLKRLGGATDPRNAACKYYSGSNCQPGRTPANVFYGDQVMGKKLSIEKQIAAAIAKGEIQ